MDERIAQAIELIDAFLEEQGLVQTREAIDAGGMAIKRIVEELKDGFQLSDALVLAQIGTSNEFMDGIRGVEQAPAEVQAAPLALKALLVARASLEAHQHLA